MHAYVYGPKFMWNIDNSVGKGASNANPADVAFLQWYYTLAADFHLTDASHRETYRKVKITGSCSGRDDDPLVAAILLQQKSMSHPFIDGKVNSVTGNGKAGNTYAFFLLRLEARFACMFPELWPRLDLIRNCPTTVKEAAKYAVPQLSELGH